MVSVFWSGFVRRCCVFWVAAAAAMLFLAGCAGESVTRYASPSLGSGAARSVAVLPLANLTTHPNAGQILGEMLHAELRGIPSFSLRDNTEAWAELTPPDQDIEEAALGLRARQAGKKLGVDAVVYGSVTEYRYKRGLDEEPAVGVAVRLMDVSTGEVLFTAVVSRIGGCGFFCRDSLSRTAQAVCAGIAGDMREAAGRPGGSGGAHP